MFNFLIITLLTISKISANLTIGKTTSVNKFIEVIVSLYYSIKYQKILK